MATTGEPENLFRQASRRLRLRLFWWATSALYFEPHVNALAPWANQNQFDALADFWYNEGPASLATMLHHGQAAVPVQMASWCHEHVNGVVVKSAGLLSRREKEIALYSSTTPTDQPQVLSGHVPQAVANSRVLHELSGATRLNLAIGLPLRNQSELDSLLLQLSDPASPNFGHYLSAEQFAAEFGPTEQDYRALISKRARAAKPLPRRRKTASTAAWVSG